MKDAKAGIRMIGICLVLAGLGCQTKTSSHSAPVEEPVPEVNINQHKKLGFSNEPDESAYLPFCQDSTEIPRYKKRFCAQKILSSHLINSHPEWKEVVGVVYIGLTINADSTVVSATLEHDFSGDGIGDAVAKSCYDYLKDVKCIPAKKKGLRIKSKLVMPIYFGLELLDEKFVQ